MSIILSSANWPLASVSSVRCQPSTNHAVNNHHVVVDTATAVHNVEHEVAVTATAMVVTVAHVDVVAMTEILVDSPTRDHVDQSDTASRLRAQDHAPVLPRVRHRTRSVT
jgi:hypothetical protein